MSTNIDYYSSDHSPISDQHSPCCPSTPIPHLYERNFYFEKKLLLKCKQKRKIGDVFNIVKRDKTKIFQLLHVLNTDPSAEEEGGNYAIHFASKNGRVKLIHLLLHAGAKVNARNMYNQTPLMICAKGSKLAHFLTAQYLLQEGADVDIDAKDGDGGTALRQAIIGSSYRVVKLLLEYNANLHWNEEVISCPCIFDKNKNNKELKRNGYRNLPVALSFAIGVWKKSLRSRSYKQVEVDVDRFLEKLELKRIGKILKIPLQLQHRMTVTSRAERIVELLFNFAVENGYYY